KAAPAEPADAKPSDGKTTDDTATADATADKPPAAADTATGDATADEPGEEAPAASATATLPLGTLVAGVGVPRVDSRGAVPAAPIVKRPLMSGDTDPDGIPAVRPDDEQPGDAAAERTGTAKPATTDPDTHETGP